MVRMAGGASFALEGGVEVLEGLLGDLGTGDSGEQQAGGESDD